MKRPPSYSAKATASATVANQPIFDGGGFPVKTQRILAGEPRPWETLSDTVEVDVTLADRTRVRVENVVAENLDTPISTHEVENTAARAVCQAIIELKTTAAFDVRLKLTKGISCLGTGLGSSGASPAAALWAFEQTTKQMGIEPLSDFEKIRILVDADNGVPDNSVPAYIGGAVDIHRVAEYPPMYLAENIAVSEDFGSYVCLTPHDFGIPTKEAREVLKGIVPDKEKQRSYRAQMKTARNLGETDHYGALMERAHGWFVGRRRGLYPEDGSLYTRINLAAKEAGASGVTISGAGPTILAVCRNDNVAENVGLAMYRELKGSGHIGVARHIVIDNHGADIAA